MVRANAPLDARIAAREVSAIDSAELARQPQDQAHMLFAIRSAVLAFNLAPVEVRTHLAAGIRSLVMAARSKAQHVAKTSARFEAVTDNVRRYWLQGGDA